MAENIDTLIRLVSEARHVNASGRDIRKANNGGSRRVCKILEDSRRVCMDRHQVDSYLSRAESALTAFRRLFPESPRPFLTRAPGRVNLIGEHTDYNGLPVLPIAINRDIMLVASPRNDASMCIRNIDPRFRPRRFNISESVEPYSQGDWGNYAKAAAQSIYRLLSDIKGQSVVRGLNIVVDGNIPVAGGLASSSALIVAFGCAILSANGCDIDSLTVAETLASGEHYVGTRGGGMDQVACLMGRDGHATRIAFFPTSVEHVPLPSGYSFVVCHSRIDAPKTTTARSAYNLRAAESHIAAAMIGKALGERTSNSGITIQRLGDLYSDALELSEPEIDSLMESTFAEDTYSLVEIARFLELDEESVRRLYPGAVDKEDCHSLCGLKPHGRSRHVISEGRRVLRATDALRAGRMDEFGKLMYESHESCAHDYEISIPELDALVSIAKEEGALGARLTGAGFGGCTINLVRDADVEGFVEAIGNRYYRDRFPAAKTGHVRNGDRLEDIFICKAVQGAGSLFM